MVKYTWPRFVEDWKKSQWKTKRRFDELAGVNSVLSLFHASLRRDIDSQEREIDSLRQDMKRMEAHSRKLEEDVKIMKEEIENLKESGNLKRRWDQIFYASESSAQDFDVLDKTKLCHPGAPNNH